MKITDWLGVETEWRHALLDPALARCAKGETTPAAEWAAYRAAVAWGRSCLFGVALGDWDGTLALPLARSAARRLTECLSLLRQRADNLPQFWEKADNDIEAREECLALLEGRMEAWAAFDALDEVQLDALVNSLAGRSELAAECHQAQSELAPADEALLRHKEFISVGAGSELLANWRRLLVEPYQLSLPWWLNGTLEEVAGRLWNGLPTVRSGAEPGPVTVAVALLVILLAVRRLQGGKGVAADAGTDPTLAQSRIALAATTFSIEGDEEASVHLDVADTPAGAQVQIWISGAGTQERYARAVVEVPGGVSDSGPFWQGLALVPVPGQRDLPVSPESGLEVYLEESTGTRRRVQFKGASV